MSCRSVLIVDDNPAFAENVAEVLEATGHEAVIETEPKRALELLRHRRFDALITDMRMPQVNGAELVREVRGIDPGLPVVLVTAYANDAELRCAQRDGVAAVLPKAQQLLPKLLATLDGLRRDAMVLLVEDDAALRETLTEALAGRGYTVIGLADLEDLDATAARPCVALVDLRLRGCAFGQALERARARFPGTPVLIISAYAQELGQLEGAELFAKPFDTAALIARIEALTPGGSP